MSDVEISCRTNEIQQLYAGKFYSNHEMKSENIETESFKRKRVFGLH
jgi:hypothetical protein